MELHPGVIEARVASDLEVIGNRQLKWYLTDSDPAVIPAVNWQAIEGLVSGSQLYSHKGIIVISDANVLPGHLREDRSWKSRVLAKVFQLVTSNREVLMEVLIFALVSRAKRIVYILTSI